VPSPSSELKMPGLQHTMKAYRILGVKLHALCLGTKWRWVVSFKFWLLYLCEKGCQCLVANLNVGMKRNYVHFVGIKLCPFSLQSLSSPYAHTHMCTHTQLLLSLQRESCLQSDTISIVMKCEVYMPLPQHTSIITFSTLNQVSSSPAVV
jgi:hypothetical protein